MSGLVVRLSGYSLARLCDDGEFILYRTHAKEMEAASFRPSPEVLRNIAIEEMG
jgi:hypothetical protein